MQQQRAERAVGRHVGGVPGHWQCRAVEIKQQRAAAEVQTLRCGVPEQRTGDFVDIGACGAAAQRVAAETGLHLVAEVGVAGGQTQLGGGRRQNDDVVAERHRVRCRRTEAIHVQAGASHTDTAGRGVEHDVDEIVLRGGAGGAQQRGQRACIGVEQDAVIGAILVVVNVDVERDIRRTTPVAPGGDSKQVKATRRIVGDANMPDVGVGRDVCLRWRACLQLERRHQRDVVGRKTAGARGAGTERTGADVCARQRDGCAAGGGAASGDNRRCRHVGGRTKCGVERHAENGIAGLNEIQVAILVGQIVTRNGAECRCNRCVLCGLRCIRAGIAHMVHHRSVAIDSHIDECGTAGGDGDAVAARQRERDAWSVVGDINGQRERLRCAAVVHYAYALGLRLRAHHFAEEGEVDGAGFVRVERCDGALQCFHWIDTTGPGFVDADAIGIARQLEDVMQRSAHGHCLQLFDAAIGEALLEQRHHACRVRRRHGGAGQHQVLTAGQIAACIGHLASGRGAGDTGLRCRDRHAWRGEIRLDAAEATNASWAARRERSDGVAYAQEGRVCSRDVRLDVVTVGKSHHHRRDGPTASEASPHIAKNPGRRVGDDHTDRASVAGVGILDTEATGAAVNQRNIASDGCGVGQRAAAIRRQRSGTIGRVEADHNVASLPAAGSARLANAGAAGHGALAHVVNPGDTARRVQAQAGSWCRAV